VRVDDLGLLLELIRHGHGVGLTRNYFARDMLERGEVVRLFDVQLSLPPHVYHMVYPPGSTKRPQVVLLIEWMRSVFRNV
jgi:DNA-binding transcriptional LysR family regulator